MIILLINILCLVPVSLFIHDIPSWFKLYDEDSKHTCFKFLDNASTLALLPDALSQTNFTFKNKCERYPNEIINIIFLLKFAINTKQHIKL